MIAGWLTLPATLLLAAGTPRQAALLSRRRWGERRRRALRLAGIVLLALSLVLTGQEPEWPRRLAAWVGLLGVDAVGVALSATLLTTLVERRRGPRDGSTPRR